MSGFYKMDPAAWDFGTANLSLEEEAAYLRIVNAIHKHDAGVPDNDRVIAGLFRVSTRKARSLVNALVGAGKLVVEDGQIWNDRARSDMVQRQFATISRAESGAKGGRKRAENAAKSLENNDAGQASASTRIEENRIEYTDANASVDEIAVALSEFNASAEVAGWPTVRLLSQARRAALKARLGECGGIDGWRAALAKARASPHCCGQNDRGWVASFDFLTRQSSFAKLMEGNYDRRSGGHGNAGMAGQAPPGGGGRGSSIASIAARRAAERAEKVGWPV